ncbi:MAG: hypothetical protein R6U42_07050, partial [Halomonas sp.]
FCITIHASGTALPSTATLAASIMYSPQSVQSSATVAGVLLPQNIQRARHGHVHGEGGVEH